MTDERRASIKSGLTIVGIIAVFVILSPWLLPFLGWATNILVHILLFIILCVLIGAFIVSIGTLYNKKTEGELPGYYRLQSDEGKRIWRGTINFLIGMLIRARGDSKEDKAQREHADHHYKEQ